MFNENQKKQFLDETGRDYAIGASIFGATEKAEEQYGADLAVLPKDAIQEIVDEKLGIREKSVEAALIFLKSYFSWCKEKGFDVGDGLDGIIINPVEKIKNAMVASPKHLNDLLDKAFDPIQMETMDCIYRCFLWMAFSGLEDTDAIDVKINEVDFHQMLIKHGEKEYILYKESLLAFRKGCSLTEFLYINPKYLDKVIRNRFPGDYLMRGIRSEKISLGTMRGIIRSHFKDIGMKLSYNRIYFSGIYYRAYEIEKAGGKADFSFIAREKALKNNKQYDKRYEERKAISAVERGLINDYENWKRAFIVEEN